MVPGGMPSATALASIGDPSAAQCAALDRSSRRYGLVRPPSPSTACQTGASASNNPRRAAASGSVASRFIAVGRSIVSPPTRIDAPTSPNRR